MNVVLGLGPRTQGEKSRLARCGVPAGMNTTKLIAQLDHQRSELCRRPRSTESRGCVCGGYPPPERFGRGGPARGGHAGTSAGVYSRARTRTRTRGLPTRSGLIQRAGPACGAIVLGGPLADEYPTCTSSTRSRSTRVRDTFTRDPWSGSHLDVDSVEAWTIRLDGRRVEKDVRRVAVSCSPLPNKRSGHAKDGCS